MIFLCIIFTVVRVWGAISLFVVNKNGQLCTCSKLGVQECGATPRSASPSVVHTNLIFVFRLLVHRLSCGLQFRLSVAAVISSLCRRVRRQLMLRSVVQKDQLPVFSGGGASETGRHYVFEHIF